MEQHQMHSFPSIGEGLRSMSYALVSESKRLGAGAYGEIVIVCRSGQAEKILTGVKVQPENEKARNEVEVHRRLDHQNIIKYNGDFSFMQGNKLMMAILLEFAIAGDLRRELNRFPDHFVCEATARSYALQISYGLIYLHDKMITHNDIHAKNILLVVNNNGSKTCKICDFGLAEIVDPRTLTDDAEDNPFEKDIISITDLIFSMTAASDERKVKKLSRACREVIRISLGECDCPTSVRDLVSLKWFTQKTGRISRLKLQLKTRLRQFVSQIKP
jgi:serine/threonine protein kinase